MRRLPDCWPVQWRALGYPKSTAPPRRSPGYEGTDRHARGVVLAVLRSDTRPVRRVQLRAAWTDDVQLDRAIDGLVTDGLVEPLAGDRFQLPT